MQTITRFKFASFSNGGLRRGTIFNYAPKTGATTGLKPAPCIVTMVDYLKNLICVQPLFLAQFDNSSKKWKPSTLSSPFFNPSQFSVSPFVQKGGNITNALVEVNVTPLSGPKVPSWVFLGLGDIVNLENNNDEVEVQEHIVITDDGFQMMDYPSTVASEYNQSYTLDSVQPLITSRKGSGGSTGSGGGGDPPLIEGPPKPLYLPLPQKLLYLTAPLKPLLLTPTKLAGYLESKFKDGTVWFLHVKDTRLAGLSGSTTGKPAPWNHPCLLASVNWDTGKITVWVITGAKEDKNKPGTFIPRPGMIPYAKQWLPVKTNTGSGKSLTVPQDPESRGVVIELNWTGDTNSKPQPKPSYVCLVQTEFRIEDIVEVKAMENYTLPTSSLELLRKHTAALHST